MVNALLLCLLVVGCTTTSLTLTPMPTTDRTVPDHTEKRFRSVMVLPPRGSDRGAGSELAGIERALLQGGLKVISSGYTGRVVLDQSGSRVETAANLSDLERALIMAREGSKAEALLQVLDGTAWTREQRKFVERAGRFEELRAGDQADSYGVFRVDEEVFRFQARVINVEDGEIVMSVDLSQGTSKVLPQAKTMEIQSAPVGNNVREIDTDNPERRQLVVDQVMRALLARLNSRPPG